jgi:hypothetical protein
MFKSKVSSAVSAVAAMVIMVGIAGCGGGGSSSSTTAATTTLSGTAAGGAAIIGNVTITDSSGKTLGGPIDSTGHYSIDVSTLTAPFVLHAAGQVGNTAVSYYSAATSSDVGKTIDITPFTNLIVSNLAGEIAETYFATHNPSSTMITDAGLSAEESALQAKLQPILTQLGIDAGIDLLRASFAANHSGLDAVMDLVKVETNTTTNIVTIKNAITQAVISTDDTTTKSDDNSSVDATMIKEITTGVVTDLQAITTQMNNFAKLFATTLPTVTQITNSGLVDTSSAFMDHGTGFTQWATQMSTDPSNIGMTFSNIAIHYTSSTTATMTAALKNNSGATETIEVNMVKSNNKWLIQGNGRIADLSLHPQAARHEWISGTSSPSITVDSGLNIYIDPFDYNAGHTSRQITSAHIDGPGLGTAGIDMNASWAGHTEFGVVGMQNYNTITECMANNSQTPCLDMTKVTDNSVYTVTLKDANAVTMAVYNINIPKAPIHTANLTSAMFPSISSLKVNGIDFTLFSQLVSNANIAVAWTLPAGTFSDYVQAWAYDTNGTQYYNIDKNLLPTDTAVTINIGNLGTNTPSNEGLWISVKDGYGRQFGLDRSVQ